MLRSNLATRPFYNERLVHWLLGASALLVILATAYNVNEHLRLSGRQGGLVADATRDENLARTLSARAADARRRIDPKGLQRISAQAMEANAIIGARTFAWTTLFDDIEATLPPTVMLTAITPRVAEDGATVRFVVVGRTVEAIDTFIERLEATQRFSGVQPGAEQVTDDGMFQTDVAGRYAPFAPAAPAKPAAAGPGDTPGRKGAR